MKTQRADEQGLPKAAEILKKGGIIVYPTDTLYGIGASIFHPDAISRIFDLKNMSAAPQSIIMNGIEMIREYAVISSTIREFLEIFPVGPYTLLIPLKKEKLTVVPDVLVKDGKIGIRIPINEFPRHLASMAGPFTSTSANEHGGPAPKSFNGMKLMGADLYIDDGPCLFGQPSTILMELDERIKIVRHGALAEPVVRKYMEELSG